MGERDLGSSHERRGLTLPVPIRRADVEALCDRAHDLVEEGPARVLDCDVAAIGVPDLSAVEALARVELTARRLGGRIRLRGASVELLDLLALCGLPLELVLEAEGQSEEREEARGVEEEGDPGDPVA